MSVIKSPIVLHGSKRWWKTGRSSVRMFSKDGLSILVILKTRQTTMGLVEIWTYRVLHNVLQGILFPIDPSIRPRIRTHLKVYVTLRKSVWIGKRYFLLHVSRHRDFHGQVDAFHCWPSQHRVRESVLSMYNSAKAFTCAFRRHAHVQHWDFPHI